MSKFFVTNSIELIKRVETNVKNSEYQVSFKYLDDSKLIYALSTKKLVCDNQNGANCENGFTIITGTMAWDNGRAVNSTVLQDIHEDFDADIDVIRKKSIGNYACVILKNHTLYVFGEIAGFYNIYYYNDDQCWFISNSLYDIQLVLKDKLTIDKMNIVESTIQGGIMLDGTYFNEVKRLSGFNYLRIDVNSFEVIEEDCLYPMADGTLLEKVECYKKLSMSYAQKMGNAYGAPVISMTGGLDARMVLASYLAAGLKPHLYYGTGNSLITNTYNQDREIDKQFSKKFSLIFHNESWETPTPLDKYWNYYLPIYGFYYDTYAGSEAFVESLKDNPCKLATFGYCGELLRNLPWIESRKQDFFTLEEYLKEYYYTDSTEKQVVNAGEYRQHIWNKLLRICDHYHLDKNHIANEDIFYLSLERRKSADASLVNFTNFMKYCSYSLGQYENLCAGRITSIEASNSSFMLYCLNALQPDVLDVPVFSHCTTRIFNRETMSLETPESIVPQGIKAFLKIHFPEMTKWATRILVKILKRKFDNDDEIASRIMSLYKKWDNLEIVNPGKFEDKRNLVSYVMKVYALKN